MYIDVLTRASDFWQYVGSAIGKYGVKHRIIVNHLNLVYRKKEPPEHYRRMEQPDVTPHFCLLAKFEE